MFHSAPPRSPLKTLPFFIAMAVAFIGLSFIAKPASAEHRYTEFDVELTQLDASVRHGSIVIDYAVSRHDWRRLQRNHITPRLNLYTNTRRSHGFSYAYSVPLSHRIGRVTFPAHLTPRRLSAVEVRLSGRRGRTRIARTEYGASCANRIRLAVQRPRSRRHHHAHGPKTGYRVDHAALIRACGKQVHDSSNVPDCAVKASKLGRHGEATIAACGRATHWSDDLLSCLDRSAGILRNPASTVHACAAATHWNDDFNQCLDSAQAYRTDARPAIAACKQATHWSDDFNQCLVTGARLRDAASIVRACKQATHWSDDFQQCVESAA